MVGSMGTAGGFTGFPAPSLNPTMNMTGTKFIDTNENLRIGFIADSYILRLF